MKRKISPEQAAKQVFEIEKVETEFAERFAEMSQEDLIAEGVAIFACAAEGISIHNEEANNRVSEVLTALLTPKAPESFMSGVTAAAWRMYTQELIRRIANNSSVSLAEVSPNYGEEQDPKIESEIDLDGLSPEQFQAEMIMALHGLRSEVQNG